LTSSIIARLFTDFTTSCFVVALSVLLALHLVNKLIDRNFHHTVD